MDAREIESLSMLSRGFQELRDVNPELSFNVILDILSGINEYVKAFFFWLYPSAFMLSLVMRLFGNMYKHPEVSFLTNELRERAR